MGFPNKILIEILLEDKIISKSWTCTTRKYSSNNNISIRKRLPLTSNPVQRLMMGIIPVNPLAEVNILKLYMLTALHFIFLQPQCQMIFTTINNCMFSFCSLIFMCA